MDTNSIQNSAGDSLMKNKRRRKKANKTDELLNMNQMDDALEVPHLQNNLMELGSQSQAKQSQIVTKPIELHAGQTVLRKKKKREQKKMEAKIEGELQSMDQMDDHLEVPAIGKLCNDVQNKLIVLDSTAQWHVEQSKMDRRSTENITEGTVLSKSKKKKQKKKKSKNEAELRSMDQMDDHYIGKICTGTNSDLQNNFVELDSTALLHVEQSKMNSGSSENISEGTVQRKKRKRKQKKEKAKNEGELQSVDHMDDQLEVPAIGKLCIVADNDLQNNLIELDSTAQWHVEQSKMDTRSTENITEGTVQRKKKEKKQKKKKDKNEGELQIVDHMDNHLEAPAIGKLCIVANNDLQNNLIELDSSEQWHVEQSKMDTRSTENITEGTAQRKRREKKQKKKKAKNESELQSVNQMDDRLEAPADNDLQNNLIELDSSAQWHVKQSKMDTRSTENIKEGTTQRKKKKKKQKKNEAKNESELQSVDQMDDHLGAQAIGKLCTVANSNLQNDLIELDSTARLHVELSKIDTSSTENNTERRVLSKKENRKQKKKKDKNEGEHHSLDRANNDLQKNIIELGLTAQLHLEQSKMDTRSIENISEGTVQKEKRKRKQKKKKAKNEGELESVDQMDDHLEVPSIGKLCIVANNDLQNNLIELDSTAKWHVEQSKMDTRSTENTTEGTVQRKRRKKKKAKNEELHRVNQMDDHLEAPALGKPFIVANDDLQNNLVELDSTAQFNTEEAKMGTRSTKNLSEGLAQRKRRWRKQNEMRANTKDERQSVGIMSNLNLPDVTHGVGNGTKVITNESTTSLLQLVHDTMKPVGLNKNKASLAPVDIDSKSYSEFLELRSAPMEGPREMEVEMFSCKSRHIPLPHEMSSKNEKIENEFKKEENIVHQGKDSAACSSCDVAVTKHLSSPILKEDHLSNDSFLGIAPVASVRRKLLVLDVNGLLADIVMPAPKDSVADTRLLGRAVFRRPFCNDFLKFCFENFDVAIWSSRSKKVIDIVVDYLLGDLRQKLLFCWDISQSTQTRFKTIENEHKPLVMKELKKIWEKYDPRLPWEKGYYNETNTLLLDDSPYKALLNPLHTAIFPYSYHYKDKSDNSLGPGGNLRVYLEDMLKCDNVKRYVEQHPFGQGAIDERNIYWSFYSRVLESVSAKSF
ncbi:Phospho phosphatase [Olea europaea subsp. europaea]|uniref:Phospho phosphatase n=1 Tax=Olea europaea subsp. europaea TaxID=158383 RepID=A0A8S0SGF1_OLEEU|nr:Phospho phosphatase [Olea europaea subsp. europaea]